MTDSDLWSSWLLWMGVATVVVLIAAGLLIFILVTARQILREAVRALNAAEEIRKNTTVIWQLQTTNDVAEDILSTVRALEAKGGALADALQSHAPARRS